MRLSKETRQYLLYLGVLFLAVILNYKLPHQSITLIEYMIKPLQIGGYTLFIAKLFSLGILLYGIIGMVKLEGSRKRNRILVFFLIVIVYLPFMKWSLHFVRYSFYRIKQDTLASLDMKEPDIRIQGNDQKATITLEFEVIDFGRGNQPFRFRVFLPESIHEFTGIEVYESETDYRSGPYPIKIQESFEVLFDDVMKMDQLYLSDWQRGDTVYELYNEKETVQIIDQGYTSNE